MNSGVIEMPRWTPGEARELAARDDDSAGGFRVAPSDPELAEIARIDRQIGGIVQRVRVPVYLRRAVLDRLAEREAIHRKRVVRRRFAIGMTAAAAALLLAAILLPGHAGLALDSESVALAAADLADSPEDADWQTIDRAAWPTIMNIDLAMGQQEVPFLGRSVAAYRMTNGHIQAMLLVVPRSALPPQLRTRQRVSISTRQREVHFIPTHDAVCVLVLPAGADPQPFQAAHGVA